MTGRLSPHHQAPLQLGSVRAVHRRAIPGFGCADLLFIVGSSIALLPALTYLISPSAFAPSNREEAFYVVIGFAVLGVAGFAITINAIINVKAKRKSNLSKGVYEHAFGLYFAGVLPTNRAVYWDEISGVQVDHKRRQRRVSDGEGGTTDVVYYEELVRIVLTNKNGIITLNRQMVDSPATIAAVIKDNIPPRRADAEDNAP